MNSNKQNKNIFPDEIKDRMVLHKRKLGYDKKKEIPPPPLKSNEIKAPVKETDFGVIMALLKRCKRDCVEITVTQGDKISKGNKITHISDEFIVMTPHFVEYANTFCEQEKKENKIKCFLFLNSIEYTFYLRKLSANKFALPKEISSFKRRDNERFNDSKKRAVAFFVESTGSELIGNIVDISKTGIRIAFHESLFNGDHLHNISELYKSLYSIIIENDKKYISILIQIKKIINNRCDDSIFVAAEFRYSTPDEMVDIISIITDISKECCELEKTKKTFSLLLSSNIS